MTGPRIDAVVFDMDGVLFEGRNFWLDLHRAYGTEAEALALADRYLASDYSTLARITARRLWAGRDAAPYLDLVRERRYQPGVAEVVASLRGYGLTTVLVSSGPDLLADRAQRDLGLDAAAANGLGIRDGRLSGALELRVRDTDKAAVAARLLGTFGVTPDRAAAVGDTGSDVEVLRSASLGVAYNSSSAALDAVADLVLPYGHLAELVPAVRRCAHRPSA